jgi:hypothetical protein
MLQLSFPDENTAMLIGLAGAVVEVGTRIYFYTLFTKAGLKNLRMNAEERLAYAKRGKLRVQDASNDMIVEVREHAARATRRTCISSYRSHHDHQYMSSIMAGVFLIYLAPTGLFSFASDSAVDAATVVKLCLLQIVPEVFLDFYCTFME